MDYKKLFNDTNILDVNTDIPGEYVRKPFGRKIRNNYLNEILNILNSYGYEEWHFNDFLSEEGVNTMEYNIMPIKDKIYPIKGISSKNKLGGSYFLAPTHEIAVSQSLQRQIKTELDLPIKLMHIGSAFRKQYNRKFPFGLSKRNTYIEVHNIQTSRDKMLGELESIKEINRKIIGDIFKLPYIESSRPYITNNPVSKETIGLDVITEYNKTLHSGMIYIQEDIFSKAFGVKYFDKELNTHLNTNTIHFGFTDNLLMAILLHAFNVGNKEKLILPNSLMPYHIICTSQNSGDNFSNQIKKILDSKSINVGVYQSFEYGTTKNKNILDMINKQNPYIHIKENLGSDEDNIIYRIQGKNERNSGSIYDIINIYHKLKDEREKELISHKKDIENRRIIETSSIIGINDLISEGYVIKIPLDNNDDNILKMEKILLKGEILGFTKNNISCTCVLTNNLTLDVAFISKRL